MCQASIVVMARLVYVLFDVVSTVFRMSAVL